MPSTLVVGRYRSFSRASGGVHADTVGDGLRNATSPGRTATVPAVVGGAKARPRPAVGASDKGAAVPAAVAGGAARNEVTHSCSEAVDRLVACMLRRSKPSGTCQLHGTTGCGKARYWPDLARLVGRRPTGRAPRRRRLRHKGLCRPWWGRGRSRQHRKVVAVLVICVRCRARVVSLVVIAAHRH